MSLHRSETVPQADAVVQGTSRRTEQPDCCLGKNGLLPRDVEAEAVLFL